MSAIKKLEKVHNNCLAVSMPSKERRLLLEAILKWEGRLKRSRVQELFGLKPIRASEWIRDFYEKNPTWLKWDKKTKCYHATETAYHVDHHPKLRTFFNESSSLLKYLSIVGIPHYKPTENSKEDNIIWSAYPDLSVPSPSVFGPVADAIRSHRAVQINYRSMREPAPHCRKISPHSIVRVGRRWHVRAFCSLNQDFRDYALGRISDVEVLEDVPSERLKEDDSDWIKEVKVRLIAHPALSREQKEVIGFEYFHESSAIVEICRGALVHYFIHDMRAAIDTEKQRPPDYQLAVENIKEVKPWLFPE